MVALRGSCSEFHCGIVPFLILLPSLFHIKKKKSNLYYTMKFYIICHSSEHTSKFHEDKKQALSWSVTRKMPDT